jgi:hypothetical protein
MVSPQRLIHVGSLQEKSGKWIYLFLREKSPNLYQWTKDNLNGEIEMPVSGLTIEDAIAKANKFFKADGFKFLNCGFRYTLPERDEHGINALFFQMIESYNSSNGVYFDEILGNNCHVQFASIEAQNLFRKLKQENRL